MNKDMIKKYKEASVESLKRELDNDTSICSIMKYLKKKSMIHHRGNMGTDTYVNKEALRLASVYLQDYLDILDCSNENNIETIDVDTILLAETSDDISEKIRSKVFENSGLPSYLL